MNTFIEKNMKLLKFFHAALRLSGWLSLASGLFSPIVLIVVAKKYDPQMMRDILLYSPLNCFTLLFLGLFAIGLAQLIRHLFDSNRNPGFILHHGDKIIYAYVVFTLIVATIRTVTFVKHLLIPEIAGDLIFISSFIANMVYYIANVIIFIGVALFLRRLLPVIDEHKSLI
ncbi:MAG: hypothetical protein ACYSOF_09890 [Planctomycetota bacterium]|jgi:hypothetical protein